LGTTISHYLGATVVGFGLLLRGWVREIERVCVRVREGGYLFTLTPQESTYGLFYFSILLFRFVVYTTSSTNMLVRHDWWKNMKLSQSSITQHA
jgi:hypothetical protein